MTIEAPITVERLLDTTPEETFALITEPERMRRWMAMSGSIDVRAGGEYRLLVAPGNIATGVIEEVEPGRRIVFSWGWANSEAVPPGSTTLTVELEPVGQQTRVRFTHSGLVGEQAELHLQGWNDHADRLVAVAGGAVDGGFEGQFVEARDGHQLSSPEAREEPRKAFFDGRLVEGQHSIATHGIGEARRIGVLLLRRAHDDGAPVEVEVLENEPHPDLDLGVEAVATGEIPPNSEGIDFFNTGVELITDAPVDAVESQDTAFGLENCWG